MTSDEQNALRLLLREEVNAAIYASEQRMGGRFDQLDGRIDQLDGQMGQLTGRMDRLDDRVGRLDGRVDRLETGQRELQTNFAEIKVDLTEVILVLDTATRVINEIQANQRALEIKVDESTAALRHDMKRLETTVQNYAKLLIDMNGATNERITVHERMRIEETHPYLPYSPSTE